MLIKTGEALFKDPEIINADKEVGSSGFEIKNNHITIPIGLQEKVQLDKLDRDYINEFGVINNPEITQFGDEALNLQPVTVDKLFYMAFNDGMIMALLNVLTLPIIASNYSFKLREQDKNKPKAKETKDFIEQVLTVPPYDGGMSTPLQDVIAQMSLGCLSGFSLHEKVFDYRPSDRKIILKKLGYRAPTSITMLQDNNGDYNGVKQVLPNTAQPVEIPQDKTSLFVYGKHFNHLYGCSAFRAPYYHYEKKHKLYYILHVAQQQAAVPAKIGEHPIDADEDELKRFNQGLGTLGFRGSMSMPVGWSVKPFGGTLQTDEGFKLIEHHDNSMAKSCLAHFINLSKGGSYALSENQTDFFTMAETSFLNSVATTINYWIIPQLSYWNYGNGVYPYIQFDIFNKVIQSILKEIFLKLVEKRGDFLTLNFIQEIEQRMSNLLGLEINYEEILKKGITSINPNNNKNNIENNNETITNNNETIPKANLNNTNV